jgi:CRAL/TRIO domain
MRGHARSLKRNDNSGHAMVWIRAGVKTSGVTDPECYFRAILNSLEMAVADTLHRSHQKVGKFNVVLDAAHTSFHMLPNLGDTKKAIVMLQDHFPDRLGMVILANLSKASEFLLNMIKPLITKEVRDKILVLPGEALKRQRILEAIVEHEFIPDYLGGTDTYRFDAKEYYHHKRYQWTDAEAKEYLETMPYHA